MCQRCMSPFTRQGVYELDTTCVRDVLELQTRFPGARPVRVSQGRALESVWVLIPNSQVVDCGFHNVTLIDMG